MIYVILSSPGAVWLVSMSASSSCNENGKFSAPVLEPVSFVVCAEIGPSQVFVLDQRLCLS
jgi:hypothetical protein